jgi:hypothetical protein
MIIRFTSLIRTYHQLPCTRSVFFAFAHAHAHSYAHAHANTQREINVRKEPRFNFYRVATRLVQNNVPCAVELLVFQVQNKIKNSFSNFLFVKRKRKNMLKNAWAIFFFFSFLFFLSIDTSKLCGLFPRFLQCSVSYMNAPETYVTETESLMLQYTG